MDRKELQFRIRRMIEIRIEYSKILLRWQPGIKDNVVTKNALFGCRVNAWEVHWRQHFELEKHKIELILDGKIELFGYGVLQIGTPVEWNRDPLTKKASKPRYGKLIDYRDSSKIGNIKTLWELGRHQYLIPVAIAYILTKDKRYWRCLQEHIDSWLLQNPFAIGVHWCSALEVAIRLISWSVIHSLLLLHGEQNGMFGLVNEPKKLGLRIYQQAWFVRNYLSLHSSSNNHLIGELTGLLTVTHVFDFGRIGEQWNAFALQSLTNEAKKQNFSDGVNKEQAFYYHMWVLEYLIFAHLICTQNNSPRFYETIVLMAQFLKDMATENGIIPLIGDADDGTVVKFHLALDVDPYSELLQAEEYIRGNICSQLFSQKAFWFGMMKSLLPSDIKTVKPAAAKKYPIVYADGGYVAMGGEGVHLVFDAGALGYLSIAAHGHSDALSFCLAIDNQWWLIDPGTYSYHTTQEWRNYFRSTLAHNTIQIDGESQSQIGGPFLWTRHAHAEIEVVGSDRQMQWVSGSHDGYSRIGVKHSRSIHYYNNDNKMCIEDNLLGDGLHEIELTFHLHPEVTANWDANSSSWCLTRSSSEKALWLSGDYVSNCKVVKGQKAPILGWYSEQLGKKVVTEVIVYRAAVELPLQLASWIQIGRDVVNTKA